MNVSGARRALILVAAAATFAAAVAATAYALTRPSPPLPNYHVAPTVRCLRAHGYIVWRPNRVHGAGDISWVNIPIFTHDTKHPRHGQWLVTLSFSANAKEAQAGNSDGSAQTVTRRNVDFGQEALPPELRRVASCLRTR